MKDYHDRKGLRTGESIGGRRNFLKTSIISSVSLSFFPLLYGCIKEELDYSLDLNVPTKFFDGKRCWCHPRMGIVPAAGQDGKPRVVMTMNNLDLAGSDVFYGMF